jgi:hypothetical protein
MEAVRKVVTVRKSSISFDELKQFNNKKVECIVLATDKEVRPDKSRLLKYAGYLDSGHRNTSERVDELVYGK